MTAAADLPPKRPGVCSICDTPIRDVLAAGLDGNARSWGPRLPGTRIVTMAHRDGTLSDHSLCATCTVTPDALPRLWARVLLAHAAQVPRCAPPYNDLSHPIHTQYAENVPLAVLDYGDPVPEP